MLKLSNSPLNSAQLNWKHLSGSGMLVLLLFLVSCTPPSKSISETILGSEGGLFRGFAIGESFENILKQEQLVLNEQQAGYIYYDVPLEGQTEMASITYSFDQKGLYHVIVGIPLGDTALFDPVFGEFVAHFTLRYGKPEINNKRYCTWKTPDGAEVKLVKETGTLGQGQMAIYLGRDFFMVDQILGQPGGEFRGLSMGMTLKEVKALEPAAPIDEEEDYLYYDYHLNRNDSYTLTYSFDRKGLYEIELDAYFEDNKADAEVLTELLQQHLTNLHGEPNVSPEGMATWVLATEHSDEIELNLMNDSPMFPVGKVSVSVYDWVN